MMSVAVTCAPFTLTLAPLTLISTLQVMAEVSFTTSAASTHGFNLQGATRVASDDKDGRERLKYTVEQIKKHTCRKYGEIER